MKNLLTILLFASVVFVTGCQKDNFQPVVGDCPIVMSTSPFNGATGVPLDAPISVTFNTQMDTSTLHASNFTLHGATKVNGTFSYSNMTATFRPTNSLLPNTTYTGTVTTLVKDITGNAMQENYVWTFVTGPSPIFLNNLSRFGVFAGVGIANFGLTEISNMDVGVWNANRSSITGFPPGQVFDGAIYAIDDQFPAGVATMLTNASTDLTQAYLMTENLNSPSKVYISGDQGGKTLAPGIYKSNNSLTIQNGHLTLDAKGDPNAVWIFQIGGALITQGGLGGSVVLKGGAQSKNIFWQTGESATIGTNTNFHGTVMSLNSITLHPGSTTVGRMLARNGFVNMTSAFINKP